ncbi:hypothetical protein [Halalkalicoccus ordinarius]|uniref:hypothetical protein n=1 Tax=Halalkalicoccus ordinarius TaxID=3116651 RepID=UPI00300E83FA
MIWQDLVFLIGSALSIVFLAPTLRDSDARVPLATSVPSMVIGLIYGATFASLGMGLSAVGSAAALMWLLIGLLRSPPSSETVSNRRGRTALFADDLHRWCRRRLVRRDVGGRYVYEP